MRFVLCEESFILRIAAIHFQRNTCYFNKHSDYVPSLIVNYTTAAFGRIVTIL